MHTRYLFIGLVSIGLIILGVGCSQEATPAVTATPSIEAQWESIVVPSPHRFFYLSRDLRWLIYAKAETPDSKEYSAWLADIANGKLTDSVMIADSPRDKLFRSMGYSPDGAYFVLETMAKEDVFSLWIVNVHNLQDKRLLDTVQTHAGYVIWSPNSKRFAVITMKWGADVVDINGNIHHEVVPAGTFSKIMAEVSWSPDSKQVVYTNLEKTSMDGGDVWIADVDTGKKRILTEVLVIAQPFWSPTGKSIALVESRDANIKVVNLDGEVQQTIELGEPPQYGTIIWSPDGTRLAFSAKEKTGAAYVGVITLATGEIHKIPMENITEILQWSADGQAVIVYARSEQMDTLLRVPIIP